MVFFNDGQAINWWVKQLQSTFGWAGDAAPSSVILWLRNELRLQDNPLLQRGLEWVAQGAHSLQLVVCSLDRWFSSKKKCPVANLQNFSCPKVFLDVFLSNLQLCPVGLDPAEYNSSTSFGSPKVWDHLHLTVSNLWCFRLLFYGTNNQKTHIFLGVGKTNIFWDARWVSCGSASCRSPWWICSSNCCSEAPGCWCAARRRRKRCPSWPKTRCLEELFGDPTSQSDPKKQEKSWTRLTNCIVGFLDLLFILRDKLKLTVISWPLRLFWSPHKSVLRSKTLDGCHLYAFEYRRPEAAQDVFVTCTTCLTTTSKFYMFRVSSIV